MRLCAAGVMVLTTTLLASGVCSYGLQPDKAEAAANEPLRAPAATSIVEPRELFTLAANGCGPGWMGDALRAFRDRPFGHDFGVYCDRHDECYGSPVLESPLIKQLYKAGCDLRFRDSMTAFCLAGGRGLVSCLAAAATYYRLVRSLAGQLAFWTAQNEAAKRWRERGRPPAPPSPSPSPKPPPGPSPAPAPSPPSAPTRGAASISWSAPAADATVSGVLSLRADAPGASGVVFSAYYASDPGNINTVAWHELGRAVRYSDGWGMSWDTRNVLNQGNAGWGTVNLAAIWIDSAGRQTAVRAYRRINVQNETASISWSTPAADSTIAGIVSLRADAPGASGVVFSAYYAADPGNINTVSWHVLGPAVRYPDGWGMSWDTRNVPNQGNAGWGTVNLAAIWVDSSGRHTDVRAYRRVNIRNEAPPVPRTTSTMYQVWRQENQGQAHSHLLQQGGLVTQTFVATMPYLDRVIINVASTNRAAIRVHLYRNAEQTLGWAKDVVPNDYGETVVVFDEPIPLTVGQTYYLQPYALSAPLVVYFSNVDDYAAGSGYVNWVEHGHDLNATIIGASAP